MEELDFKELFKLIWRKKIIIIAIIAVFTVGGFVFTKVKNKNAKTEYNASTSLVLTLVDNKSMNQIEQYAIPAADVTLNNQLISTYSEIVKSNKVLNEVKANTGTKLSVDELKEKVDVSVVKNTTYLTISVKDQDKTVASNLVTEIANVFIKEVHDIYNLNNVKIVDETQVTEVNSNDTQASSKKMLILCIGAGVGLALLYILGYYIFDNTVKSEKQVEGLTKLPVLANVPKNKDIDDEILLVATKPDSVFSETIKTLRTNMQYMMKEENKVFLMTSNGENEGKTVISSNLGVSFANIGKKVLIIDADMRNGKQHSIFGTKKNLGLSNYLRGDSTIKDIIQETKYKNLDIISNGDTPSASPDLLETKNMKNLIENLKNTYDFIIIDGTQCKVFADSLIISNLVDTTILVAEQNKTNKENLKRVIKNIEDVGGNIKGIVLNKSDVKVANKKRGK